MRQYDVNVMRCLSTSPWMVRGIGLMSQVQSSQFVGKRTEQDVRGQISSNPLNSRDGELIKCPSLDWRDRGTHMSCQSSTRQSHVM